MSYLEKRFLVYCHICKLTNNLVYIGSGNKRRPKSKSSRIKEHLEIFDNLNVHILHNKLTKEESENIEFKYLNSPSEIKNIVDFCDVVLLNKVFTKSTTLVLSFDELDKHFYIDKTSPSFLRWKINKKKVAKDSVAGSLGDGYFKVCLNGKKLNVHRIIKVLYEKKDLCTSLIVHHKDGDSLNNNPDNLESTSQRNNMHERHRLLRDDLFCISELKWTGYIRYRVSYHVNGIRISKTFNPKTLFPLLPLEKAIEETLKLAIEYRDSVVTL